MKKLTIIITVIIIITSIFIGWWNNQLSAISEDKSNHKVVIVRGKSVSEIARILKDEKLISSPLVFSLYVRSKGLSTKLAAGTFNLSPAMSTPQIVDALTGKPAEVWVRLIEGWRVEEMAERLNKELGIENEEFIKIAKEGYMFPDTYLFAQDTIAAQVVKRLRDTFDERFSDEIKSKFRSKGLSLEEGVILASIVEREARSERARTEVASILLKRFKIGMGLNADATLQYALGYQNQEKSWWKRHLTKEDKKIDSPYNTYLYSGLPPAPICNPGLASLQALANADSQTPYLYYYHDSKGNSHYAKTLEEHNQNVANNP